MFDTTLVVVGNVLAAPEWRRIPSSGSLVANFRIASTSRRYDRENSRWVDGNNLRVRVTAWRRLAEGVASSLTVGDPVIVYGRFYTRDWKTEDGDNRISYEMEAFSIGHDLARGRARFFRSKALQEAEETLEPGAEESEPVSEEEVPVSYGDGLPGAEEPSFGDVVAGLPDPDLPPEVEAAAEIPTRRTRRTAKREPVAA